MSERLRKLEEKTQSWEKATEIAPQNKRVLEPVWRPGEGEVLVGEITEIRRNIPTRAGPNDLLVVRPAGKEPVAIWKKSVLKKYFEGFKDPRTGAPVQFKVGDAVAVQYLGRRRGKHWSYDDYRVEIA